MVEPTAYATVSAAALRLITGKFGNTEIKASRGNMVALSEEPLLDV